MKSVGCLWNPVKLNVQEWIYEVVKDLSMILMWLSEFSEVSGGFASEVSQLCEVQCQMRI